MGWFKKDDHQNYLVGSSKLSYLRPEGLGCRMEDHLHNHWLPTNEEFEEQVRFLWDASGAEAQIAMAKLKQTSDHIGFSSAAINYFLNLTSAELDWVFRNLRDLGFGFSDAIRHQLRELGELEPLELFEELGNLASLTSTSEATAKQNRLTLTALLAASFFARIDEEIAFDGDEDFFELANLLELVRSCGNLFPTGRHLPCDEPAGQLEVPFAPAALNDEEDEEDEEEYEEGEEEEYEEDEEEEEEEEVDFDSSIFDQSQCERAPQYKDPREIPVFEILDWERTREALTLYCQGKDPYLIAEQLAKPTNDVVATLGVHIFGLEGELVNPQAKNWKTGWSAETYSSLATFFRAGKGIDEMCEALGRDRLGVLYKVFSGLNPVVPSRVIRAFKVEL